MGFLGVHRAVLQPELHWPCRRAVALLGFLSIWRSSFSAGTSGRRGEPLASLGLWAPRISLTAGGHASPWLLCDAQELRGAPFPKRKAALPYPRGPHPVHSSLPHFWE